uniref:G protein-coupled receptor 25 n=1 Tax=Loxodonta africana TaxID=9785 RepID=G3U9Z2_LOXAF
MHPTEPWSPSPWAGSEDYSGSGALEELEELKLCPSWDLPYSYAYIPVLYLVAFAVGLLGNAFVVWLLVDTFVLHLAAADLGFVLTLPLWAVAAALGGRWPFGESLCKLSSFALAGTRCAGALLLAGMSVDRYLAVKLLDARPRLLLLLLTFMLPLGVTLFCYCRISRRLRRPPHLGRARRNSLRIIFAIESTFVGSWLPFSALRAIFYLARLGALPLPCSLVLALRWGLTIATCLAFVNSCANPVIYLLLDRSFRARARRGACGTIGRLARRVSSASSLSGDDSSLFRSGACSW